MFQLANQSLRLHQKTRNVDYDQLEYVRDMSNLIKKASKHLTTMSGEPSSVSNCPIYFAHYMFSDQFSEWSKLNQREAELASTSSKAANGRK